MDELFMQGPWLGEQRPGRHVEPAGVGHRAAFVPLHAGLPEQPGGYAVMLHLRPATDRLFACVGLRHGVAKALSIHAPGEDPHAFYRRHYPVGEDAWMADIAVTEVSELGEFAIHGRILLAGDIVEVHKTGFGQRATPLVVDSKRVCRDGRCFGFARIGLVVAPVCRVEADVELYLGSELDDGGFVKNAVLDAI